MGRASKNQAHLAVGDGTVAKSTQPVVKASTIKIIKPKG